MESALFPRMVRSNHLGGCGYPFQTPVGMVMDTLSSNQALTLFGKWERENKSIVLLFSTPAAAMSFKNGRIVPFVDDCLMLSFGEDNILRIFLQAATFWRLEAGDIPEDSREVVPKFEQCVRIVSENPELQCFLCATSPLISG